MLLQIRTSGVATELMHPTGATRPVGGSLAGLGRFLLGRQPWPFFAERSVGDGYGYAGADSSDEPAHCGVVEPNAAV
jgi:hypothetical protein